MTNLLCDGRPRVALIASVLAVATLLDCTLRAAAASLAVNVDISARQPPPPQTPEEAQALANKNAWGAPQDGGIQAGFGAGPLGEPVSPDQAVADATAASVQAWAAAGQVGAKAKELLGGDAPLIQAEVTVAEVSAHQAAKEETLLTNLLAEVRSDAHATAMRTANDYLNQVKTAAGVAVAAAYAAKHGPNGATAAAHRAVAAAVPFKYQMLRGQAVVTAYSRKAQALAMASNRLKTESNDMAVNAQRLQATGNVIMANRTLATAHSLLEQATAMEEEAKELQMDATEGNAVLPTYKDMAQAAATSAALAVRPPILPN